MFRIIKMKNGFRLFPTVLEGLSKISHLINIDTVEDLLSLMQRLLQDEKNIAPPLVRLLCVHCALCTLAGPGQELQVDDELFLASLRSLLTELSGDFERWDVVFECIELCLLKRREARAGLVVAFVKLLFAIVPHLHRTTAVVALALAHTVLLRYPRARASLSVLATSFHTHQQHEDEVQDLAMKALREQSSTNIALGDGDGSWIITLLKHHLDVRYRPIISALVSRDVVAVPYRCIEAKNDLQVFPDYFNSLPTHIGVNGKDSYHRKTTPFVKKGKTLSV